MRGILIVMSKRLIDMSIIGARNAAARHAAASYESPFLRRKDLAVEAWRALQKSMSERLVSRESGPRAKSNCCTPSTCPNQPMP